jgi:hypothetical protein
MAAELKANDWQVIEPPNAEIPPKERLASGGIIKGPALYLVGENGPEHVDPSPGRTVRRKL